MTRILSFKSYLCCYIKSIDFLRDKRAFSTKFYCDGISGNPHKPSDVYINQYLSFAKTKPGEEILLRKQFEKFVWSVYRVILIFSI